jgi:hypothetical protein
MSIDPASIIEACTSVAAVVISLTAIVRSSKQKQNDALQIIHKSQADAMAKISAELNDHILEDRGEIATLKADVKNLHENLNDKLDEIIRRLQ